MRAGAAFCNSRRRGAGAGRSGQTMVFMIMALVILSFVVIWQFDLHRVISVKWRIQNGGDAAALAAARWQAVALNAVGDLNIMQAVATSLENATASAAIKDLQARLCYAGPAVGLLAAQQAAKNNGVYVNGAFTRRLVMHIEQIRNDYPSIFQEPYTGCWSDYADMLDAVASQGLAAGPDNARLYRDYFGGHVLLDLDFYDAVAGRNWCWFYWYALGLLEGYTDYHYWPDLPLVTLTLTPTDSEYFSLGLRGVETTLASLNAGGALAAAGALGAARGLDVSALGSISSNAWVITNTWYYYDASMWGGDWAYLRLVPVVGPARAEYDYPGADAVVRIVTEASRHTPGESALGVTWTAAAKPFGCLESGGGRLRPDYYGMALPAFRDVRLIPADASSGREGGWYDLEWREHVETHLPIYLQNGPSALESDCWYCRQLIVWEEHEFRQAGIEWLEDAAERYEHPCSRPGPGHGPSGGTRRGH